MSLHYPRRPQFPALIISVLIASCIPWAVSILRTPMHSDFLWLYEAWRRLVAGHTMSENIFETNPPLSLFTYAVPYGITSLTGWPPHISAFIYVAALLMLSAFVVMHATKKILGNENYIPLMVACAFVISQSIMTIFLYGERDHLIALAIVPFVMLQYALNKKIYISKKLQWCVFLAGAMIILLKPHHGLIPFCMIVCRAVTQKNIRFLKDADFLSLAFMVIAYAIMMLCFFESYQTIIFPDVIQLYLKNRETNALMTTASYAAPGFILLGMTYGLRHKIPYANFIIFLSVCALVSLIPYYVQGKNFFYHLFPAFGFFIPAAFLLLVVLLQIELKGIKITVILAMTVLISFAYIAFPLNMKFLTYKEYRSMPLTRIVSKNCEGIPECSFFLFNDNMGLMYETSYITGFEHASRFPSYWFLPILLEHKLEPELVSKKRLEYAKRVAEDLKNYKPRTLIIGRFLINEDHFFDFGAYWAVSPEFRKEWENYQHVDTMKIDKRQYFPTMNTEDVSVSTYDIYQRIENAAD